MISDADLDIDPDVRLIIDVNVGTLCQVFHSRNKANLPLTLLCLMSDIKVRNYICDMLLSRRCSSLDEMFDRYDNEYDKDTNMKHGPKYQTYVDNYMIYQSENTRWMLYITLRNMVDDMNLFLDKPDISASELGHLLAGAYYGGHDHFVGKILDRAKDHPNIESILYMGYTGALCAGRFHYIERPIDFNLVSVRCMSEALDIISERMILSKDILTKILSPFIQTAMFTQNTEERILDRVINLDDPELTLLFLTSGLATNTSFHLSVSSLQTWSLIHKHQNELVLPPVVQAQIGEFGLPVLMAHYGIRNDKEDIFQYAVSLEGMDWVKLVVLSIQMHHVAFQKLIQRMPPQFMEHPGVVAIIEHRRQISLQTPMSCDFDADELGFDQDSFM